MPPAVLWFADEACARRRVAGGKGASLARDDGGRPARAARLRRRRRACSSARSTRSACASSRGARVARGGAGARRSPAQPPRDEIAAAYERLGGGRVAVRSSATAEDSEAASFAGQQETYLDVEGADDVCAQRRRVLGVVLQRAGALLPQPQGLARRPRHGRRRAADGRGREGGRAVHRRPGAAPPRPDDRRGGLRPRRAGRVGRGDARPLRRRPRRARSSASTSRAAACSPTTSSRGSPSSAGSSRSTSARPQDIEWAIAGGRGLPAAVAAGDHAVSELDLRAPRPGSSPYWNAEHLGARATGCSCSTRTRRGGSPRRAHPRHGAPLPGRAVEFDPGTMAAHDEAYRQAHSERSARIVGDWLRGAGRGERARRRGRAR